MTGPRPLTVTSSRHPATIGAFLAATLAGLWGTFVPSGRSNAVDAALPIWFIGIYYGAMAIGGMCGVAAMALPELDYRIRAERASWYIVGWFSLFYGVAAFTTVGAPAGQAAILVGCYSPIATYRIVQITVQLRAARGRR